MGMWLTSTLRQDRKIWREKNSRLEEGEKRGDRG